MKRATREWVGKAEDDYHVVMHANGVTHPTNKIVELNRGPGLKRYAPVRLQRIIMCDYR